MGGAGGRWCALEALAAVVVVLMGVKSEGGEEGEWIEGGWRDDDWR